MTDLTSAQIDEARASHQREVADKKAWQAFCKRINDDLPNLSARVFALSNKAYAGHGFHYEMIRSLGKLMADVNNHSTPRVGKERLAFRLIVEVCAESLYEDVAKAEASVVPEQAA